MNELTLRFCDARRRPRRCRIIAERDSAEPLPAGALAAEIGGELIAAISIESRRVVADPFRPTADAVELLRRRADQIRAHPRGNASRARSRLRRLTLQNDDGAPRAPSSLLS